jgi:long-chain-fatty-acid--[acyl-carrier-protein] ligase
MLFFHGRLKRFVKLGGEMISLPAIEDVLTTAFQRETDEGPCLAVTAFGEEKPEIVLFAIRDGISRETANEAIRNAGLSALHNIRRVESIGTIPLLGSGKTNYRELKIS